MDNMEERKISASKEILVLLNLYIEAEKQITEELKIKGLLTTGLDGNVEAYAPLKKDFSSRIKSVFSKYDLPLDTKLKLW